MMREAPHAPPPGYVCMCNQCRRDREQARQNSYGMRCSGNAGCACEDCNKMRGRQLERERGGRER